MTEDRQKQSIEFYERTAAVYDEERWSTRAGTLLDGYQQRAVADLLGPVQGLKVLEVAVGTGRFAVNLLRGGANVTGLDSSRTMLGLSQEKAARAGLATRYKTLEGSATSLPCPDRSFDAVICINALNHIPDHLQVLREIARVAKPDARIVTNYTNLCSAYLPVALYVKARRKAWNKHVYTT